jgi:hypothetical protein
VAGIALLALAVLSPDRQQSLAAFVPAGPLRAIEISQVRHITLEGSGTVHRYDRDADGHWREGTLAGDTDVDAALRLLRNSAIERDFDQPGPGFGLDPPALVLTLEVPQGEVKVAFGATNPIGMARYVRLDRGGKQTWHLMPSYVADAFDQLLRARGGV